MKGYDESNCQAIIDFWKSKGLSDYAVSGWLANWLIESGFEPGNAQNTYMNRWGMTDEEYVRAVDAGVWMSPDGDDFAHDACGMGLAQWTSQGRKSGLLGHCTENGKSIADMTSQLEWAYIEYTSSGYAKTKEGCENAKSPSEAAICIMKTYEKPGSMNDPTKQQERAALAEEFYQKYFAGTPKPVKDYKLLAISAGHYLGNPKGCWKQFDPMQTREWVLNARIADKLTAILNGYDGIKILRLDDPAGVIPITIEERARTSDEHDADFYLAIHHNGGINGGSGGGVTVFHYPLDRNKEQATAIYNDLIDANGLRGNRATPIVSTTEKYEVSAPKADAILVENGFMDSSHDTPIIITEDFADNSAVGLAKFFIDYWGLKKKTGDDIVLVLNEIESERNNIKAIETHIDELLDLLRGMVEDTEK